MGQIRTWPGVAAKVGTRVYPDTWPSTATFPLLVWQSFGGPRDRTHSGDSALARIRFQFTGYGPNKSDLMDLIYAVMAAADAFEEGGPQISGPVDDYNPTTKLYQRSCDILVWDKNQLPV